MLPKNLRIFFLSFLLFSFLLLLMAGCFISYIQTEKKLNSSFSTESGIELNGTTLTITFLGRQVHIDLTPLNSFLSFVNELPFLIPAPLRLMGQGISALFLFLFR